MLKLLLSLSFVSAIKLGVNKVDENYSIKEILSGMKEMN